jgi:rod shape-determining protein MreC
LQKKFTLVLTVIVFAALLIFAGNNGYLNGALSTARGITAPVGLFFSNASGQTSGFFSGIFKLTGLQEENASLKDSLNKYQAQIAQLSEDKKENDRLKALLKFTTTHDFSYIPATVVAYDPSNIRGNITIDKGTGSGMSVGMAVISDGFLVGRIASVTKDTARVQLITDPTSAIPVSLQSADTSGIANGQIGFGLSMQKVPQGEPLSSGDTVVTTGLGGDIPKGLIIGTIEKIQKQDNSLFVTADIRPSADLSNLSRLIVIKGQ